jgi:ADP-heptose:LPS heptosyltransferase
VRHEDYHQAEQAAPADQLQPGSFVCMHVGARDSKRRWPLENFVQVAQALASRGFRIVLTGTSEEADHTLHLREQLGASCLDLTGKTTLGGLGALLKKSRLLISNDTGVSHIAAALRVPSVVIFSASDPRRWAPLDTNRHRSLGDPLASPAVEASPAGVLREAFSLLAEQPLRLEARGGGFPLLPPVDWSRLKRLLVVHDGLDADLIPLAPAVSALRTPGRALCLLTSAAGAEIGRLFAGMDRLVAAEPGSLAEPVEAAPAGRLVDRLRAESFDAAILFTPPGRSPYTAAYLCYLAGIPLRIGESKEFGGALLSHWVRKLPEGLEPEERYLALLRAVGLPSNQRYPLLSVPAGIDVRAREDLRKAACGEGLALVDYTGMDDKAAGRFAERLRDVTGLGAVDVRKLTSVSAAELAFALQYSDLVVTSRPLTARLADAFGRPLIAAGAAAAPLDGWRPRRSVSKLLPSPEIIEEQLLQASRTLLWLPRKSEGPEAGFQACKRELPLSF